MSDEGHWGDEPDSGPGLRLRDMLDDADFEIKELEKQKADLLHQRNEALTELALLMEGLFADDRPRVAACRRAALYLLNHGHDSPNIRLMAGKVDPGQTGAGVCAICERGSDSRNQHGVCTRCA